MAEVSGGRCFGDGDELYLRYHDQEWGRPQRTERELYEKVCLEGMQAGLAWITVLRKREALREVFLGFAPDRVVDLDITPLVRDARLIRSRPKLQACVTNARATIALRDVGGLADLVWSHAPPEGPAPTAFDQLPAVTPQSTDLAKALKRAGMVFVGPTTAYALMQACGLVDDHLAGCPVRPQVEALRSAMPALPA